MPGLKSYLKDPFLKSLYEEVRDAGPIRSISVDITHKCNLRCTGCYFFSEGMERAGKQGDEEAFDDFITRELDRGTNFVTIVGGEPGLVPNRLRKLHANFRVNVASNGLAAGENQGVDIDFFNFFLFHTDVAHLNQDIRISVI